MLGNDGRVIDGITCFNRSDTFRHTENSPNQPPAQKIII